LTPPVPDDDHAGGRLPKRHRDRPPRETVRIDVVLEGRRFPHQPVTVIQKQRVDPVAVLARKPYMAIGHHRFPIAEDRALQQ